MEALLHELSEIYKTLKTHKRYTLRLAAITCILIGSVLNFAAFLCAFIGFHRGAAPRYLTVWASICLGISFLWNCLDLASHSDRIFSHKQFLTVNALLFMDTLGFLCYLTLLIANGIIMNDYRYDGPVIIFAYNSVPWMVCCGIHGIIALQSVYGIIINIGYGSTCCPDCGRKAKNQSRKADSGATHSLLGSDVSRGEYQDLEADVDDD